MDIKKFRASIDAGRDTLEALSNANCMKEIKYFVEEKGKATGITSKIFLKAFSCEEYTEYFMLRAGEDDGSGDRKGTISQFAAAVIVGVYDKDPAKGGKHVFTIDDAEWLGSQLNAVQTITLFSDIMAVSGMSEDTANVEKPS